MVLKRFTIRPGFHYTTNATTTTQKQSDYKVEQSSFTLIALFLLEISCCRGRNWLNGNQALDNTNATLSWPSNNFVGLQVDFKFNNSKVVE